MASKIIRYQFIGSRFMFWILFVLGITLPLAILYLLACTIRIDEELDNPTEFLDQYLAQHR